MTTTPGFPGRRPGTARVTRRKVGVSTTIPSDGSHPASRRSPGQGASGAANAVTRASGHERGAPDRALLDSGVVWQDRGISALDRCTIVVVLKDRFSTTGKCLESLIGNTSGPYELMVVMGAVPAKLQKRWRERFGDTVRWHFEPKFLNPSEYRNIGLGLTRTPLAVLMDNDVYVRPGWLEPLIQCQSETGAAMVVPIMLHEENEIHTAGNDLYITYRNGKAFGCKELRYGRQSYFEGCSLEREKTDYGELHCQLVVAETARRLRVYDEKLREIAEVDSGLIWTKAGEEMWFEPKSVVHYDFPGRISRAEDIAPFLFKWDTRAIVEGYRYFEEKWKMDITEGGKWPEYLVFLNSKLGLLPRACPNAFGIFLDRICRTLRAVVVALVKALRSLRARMLGRGAWERP